MGIPRAPAPPKTRRHARPPALLWLGLVLALSPACQAALTPVEPRCEYGTDPLGIDTPTPRLFWKLAADSRGARQTAYRILVASKAGSLASDQGDLWDSGKVASDETLQLRYAGRTLKTSQQVFWKVQVWDAADKPSAWSQTASWTMGVLEPSQWQAKWISAQGAGTTARRFIGYHAAEATAPDDLKWVQVDLGQAVPISLIRLHPMRHAARDGFGFPVRFKLECASEPAFRNPILVADQTSADFPNPGHKPVPFEAKGNQARFVRVTAMKLGRYTQSYCFALSQLEVVSNGRNVAAGAKPTAKDSVEAFGWGLAGVTDGLGLIENPPKPTYETMLLRREFTVRPGLKRAVAHVCGLGQYEMTLNGQKAGQDLLAPGWTKYDKTCLYDTHDITPLLRPGANAIGLFLGNGMYNVKGGRYAKFTGSFGPLKAIAQIRLEYEDGSSEVLGTDERWRVQPGPITFSCVFGGEDYDARLEPRGWNLAGFADAPWAGALITTGPGGTLRGLGSAAPPLRAFETLRPVSVKPLRPGVSVHDLGQNAPVMVRLKIKGAVGASVKITPAELVRADGSVDRGSCGGGEAYWKYTLAGGATEEWFSKFFYHGCRYLQVELQAADGGAELPTLESLEGVVVHSASPPVGEFACSNDLFNRVHTLIRWAQRANLQHVLTDCPHRERLGWLEEYHLNGPSLRYEFDLAQLYTKSMNDMADSQLPNGLVPDIAPEYTVFSGGFRDSPEWGSAFVVVPWQQYLWTADLELLRRHYEGMKRYVAYLGTKSKDHIVSHGLGDWYDIGPRPPGYAQLTPIALTATAFYYYDTYILAQTARLLGQQDDAARYDELAVQIRTAFNKAFLNPATGHYATGSQCANSMALVMGLAEPAQRASVLEAVAKDVRSRGNALTAGDVGYCYLLEALSAGGRSDVIFDMNNQSDKPGYGYQLKRGATSLTEAWDAGRGSSQNHFMLGHFNEWLYAGLAGLGFDPSVPGFKRLCIRPQPVGDLTWARASFDSIRGRIISDWKKADGVFTLKLSIPPNTVATVFLPAPAPAEVTESGRPVGGSPGVRVLQKQGECAVFVVAGGTYEFRSALPQTRTGNE
jgi:alpha-L-rhamnosidase